MNSETTNTIEELGWIQKKGDRGFIKLWRQRYFSRNERDASWKLLYFQNNKDSIPKGFIDLTKVIAVTLVDERNCEFNIIVPGRIYRLKTKNADQCKQYMTAVQQMVDEEKRKINEETIEISSMNLLEAKAFLQKLEQNS